MGWGLRKGRCLGIELGNPNSVLRAIAALRQKRGLRYNCVLLTMFAFATGEIVPCI